MYNVADARIPEASRMTRHLRMLAAAAAILAGTAPALAQAPKPAPPAPAAKTPEAVMTLESGGEIRIVLFPADAPRHVDNFVKLVGRGFYDGQRFHRVVPNFVAQIGDPKSKTVPLDHPDMGAGGPGYRIPAEFNTRAFVRGVVGMARGPDPNSAGSQLFVMLADDTSLNGQYTAFGRIVIGDRVKSVRIVTR
jgi:peptidyl-prolyl cis-trans isomerase B (cyclophilin B)